MSYYFLARRQHTDVCFIVGDRRAYRVNCKVKASSLDRYQEIIDRAAATRICQCALPSCQLCHDPCMRSYR